MQHHFAAGPLSERLGDQLPFLDLMAQQQQGGRRLVVVELGDEGRQHGDHVQVAVVRGKVGPVAVVAASAEEEHLDAGLAGVLGRRDNVGIVQALDVDVLVGANVGERLDAVPIDRGGLEIQPVRGGLHGAA